jgi:acyl carrier protein
MNRKLVIKQLIIDECDKDISTSDISDDEPLFGSTSVLQLDSIDALTLSLALQKKFGVRLTDSKDLRRAFETVATLDTFLGKQQ